MFALGLGRRPDVLPSLDLLGHCADFAPWSQVNSSPLLRDCSFNSTSHQINFSSKIIVHIKNVIGFD